ncbi:MAG: hypothetical protein CL928_19235 [Deltaproteobacteria bacterium]|nr:hypothetical protein [Deltaproteobacteria bacterium]
MSSIKSHANGSISAELLEQVRNLVAHAKAVVRGSGTGVHRSHRLGGGSEFAEHKNYGPGDDLRHVDWKVFGRTDRYLVKQFESERRTEVRLVLDRSGSMAFGTTGSHEAAAWGPWPSTKWEAARALGLALAFVFLRQGDRLGLSILDGAHSAPLPARGGAQLMHELSHAVLSSQPTGSARLGDNLRNFSPSRSRPLVVLVSDLMAEDEGEAQKALAHLRARGSEVWLVHIVDPAEIHFPYEEPTLFVGLEDQQSLGLNPRELAASYRAEFAAFLDRQRTRCLQDGIHYLRVVTDEPLEEALAGFLRGSGSVRAAPNGTSPDRPQNAAKDKVG